MKQDNPDIKNSYLECDNSSEDWRESRQQTAQFLSDMKDDMNVLDVPKWDRQAMFNATTANPKTAFSLMPWLSMTCSIFAVCLVLFNVQIQQTETGVSIAFNNAPSRTMSQAEVDAAVAEGIKQYEQENELKVAQLVMQLQEQQNQSNLKLANYLLDSARKERKQDISDVFLHFTDQMAEQQSRQNIQYKQLEQAVKYQKTNLYDSSL